MSYGRPASPADATAACPSHPPRRHGWCPPSRRSLVRTPASAAASTAAGTTTTAQSETAPTPSETEPHGPKGPPPSPPMTPTASSWRPATRRRRSTSPVTAPDRDRELAGARAGRSSSGLGEVLPVNPGTPAVFDLLHRAGGRVPGAGPPGGGRRSEDLPAGVIRVEQANRSGTAPGGLAHDLERRLARRSRR